MYGVTDLAHTTNTVHVIIQNVFLKIFFVAVLNGFNMKDICN